MTEDKDEKKTYNIVVLGNLGSGKQFSPKLFMKKLERGKIIHEPIIGTSGSGKDVHAKIFSKDLIEKYNLDSRKENIIDPKDPSQSDRTKS